MADDLSGVADKALRLIPEGSVIGLGTGHTVEFFLERLAERVAGDFHFRVVPTSERTAQMARNLGIGVVALDPPFPLELTIDGADEVEFNSLNLIKGWGGALVRERIVAAASKRQIILVTSEKVGLKLGFRGKLPVEVVPFAASFCSQELQKMVSAFKNPPSLRDSHGIPFVTDNGNWILDCPIGPLGDPRKLDQAIRLIPGVVDTGLFLGTASLVLVAEGNQVRELRAAAWS